MSAATLSRPSVSAVKTRPAKAPVVVPPKEPVAPPKEVVQESPLETGEVAEALKHCSAECAALIRKAVSFHAEDVGDTLRKKWNLGKIVEEIREGNFTKPKMGNRPVSPIGVLSQAIGCSESYLNKSAQFFRVYPTEEKLGWLTSRRTKGGKPLTYGHIEQLLRLHSSDDPTNARYEQLFKEVLSNDFTPEQIDQQIKTAKQREGTPLIARGRPTPIPATVQQQFMRLLDQTDILIKNDQELYSNVAHGFEARLRSLPQSDVAKAAGDLKALVGRAQGNMLKLLQIFGTLVPALTQTEAYVNQCETAMAHEGGKNAALAIEAKVK